MTGHYEFDLVVGELYAILPSDTTVHHAGTFLGYVNEIGEETWLAFEIHNETVRFYNPRHIRSLLPESDPRRYAESREQDRAPALRAT